MQIKDSRRSALTVTGENVRQGKVYEVASRPSGAENLYLADDEGCLIRLLDGFRVRVDRGVAATVRQSAGRSPLADYLVGPAVRAEAPSPTLYREVPAKIIVGE